MPGDPIAIGSLTSWTPPQSASISAPANGVTALIFPALSKAPQINAVVKYDEAGTLADPMEDGSVATRPRFSRNRRTWSVSYRGLTLIDLTVLDFFVQQQAALGANKFWFPNQLANGGMDIVPDASSGDVVKGWAQTAASSTVTWLNFQEQNPASTLDGGNALLLTVKPGQSIPAGNWGQLIVGHRNTNLPYAPISGETYLAAGRFLIAETMTWPSGMTPGLVIQLVINYDDGSQDVFSSAFFNSTVAPAGWQEFATLGTVAAGKNVVSVDFVINYQINNNSGNSQTIANSGSLFDVRADQCGIALAASPRPYGLIAGATGIPALVRFTKPPQAAQIGRSDLVTVAFELTEV